RSLEGDPVQAAADFHDLDGQAQARKVAGVSFGQVRRLTLELKRGVPGHPALDVGPGPCHDRPLRVDREREVFRHTYAGRASKRLSAAGRTLELDPLAVVADPRFTDSYPSLAVGLIAAAGRPLATGLSLAPGRRPAAGAPRRRPGFAARPARGASPTGRQH